MKKTVIRISGDSSDSEIVFAELSRAYRELLRSRRQPARYRRLLEEYVNKSQHLTEVMRVEYRRCTLKTWSAKSFSGWNASTEVLKALRRVVFHRAAFLLNPVELLVYEREAVERMFPKVCGEVSERHRESRYRLVRGTCFVANPFEKRRISSGMGIPRRSGKPTSAEDFWFQLKTFMSYEISHRLQDETLSRQFIKAGTHDVSVIAIKSFPVLKRYFLYYQRELGENCLAGCEHSTIEA